jgi:GNAT superfamily N-acetyltransferase
MHMSESLPLQLDLKHPATDEDVSAIQDGTLWAFNVAHTGDDKLERLVIYARAETGEKIGGLVGTYLWGWLHLDTLIVNEPFRGKGIGTQLLKAAEKDAWERGYRNIYLSTMSFQARPFYERYGYEVFATLDDFPPGHQQFWLRKRLTTPEIDKGFDGEIEQIG